MRVLPVAVAALVLLGTSVPSVAQEASPARDEALEAAVAEHLGTDWFGVYVRGAKAGHAKVVRRRDDRKDRPVLVEHTRAEVTLRSLGSRVSLVMIETMRTELRPPYRLLQRVVEHRSDGKLERTTITRGQDGYHVRVLQAGEERERELRSVDWGLADAWAVAVWLREARKEGATLEFRAWDDDALRVEDSIARVERVRKPVAGGAPVDVYDVEVTEHDGSKTTTTYDSAGKMLESSVGGFLRLRLEPEDVAKDVDEQRDLFESQTIRADRAIGDPTRVKFLQLSLSARAGATLGAAPGQSIRRQEDGRYLLTLRRGGGPRFEANEQGIREGLDATVDYPAKHPDVVALARRAVGDATTAEAKVQRLIPFVSRYVRDQFNPTPTPVLEIVRTRRGDCTEHADLFTTLARAVGVPCRKVVGVMYMGDYVQTFGGHNWNEVVIDGVWTSVDSTWNEQVNDATHIRFPLVHSESMRTRSELSKDVIRVVKVQRGW